MNLWVTHKPQQQATLTKKNKFPEIFFRFRFRNPTERKSKILGFLFFFACNCFCKNRTHYRITESASRTKRFINPIFLLNSEVFSLEKVGEFRLNPGSRTKFANLPDLAMRWLVHSLFCEDGNGGLDKPHIRRPFQHT